MSRILPKLFAAAVVFTSMPAFAEFSPSPGYPRRVDADGRAFAVGFNHADCIDEKQSIELSLNDIPADATTVEIWARRDNESCADPTQRSGTGATTPSCYKVASWLRDEVVGKPVRFRPRAVISAIDKLTNVYDPSALTPTLCEKDTPMAPTQLYLQVIAFNGTSVVGWSGAAGTGAVVGLRTQYDLAGPNPPTEVKVAPTSGGLDVNFQPTVAADLKAYAVYCLPSTEGCPVRPLVAGKVPGPELAENVCTFGTPSPAGTMRVTGLRGGTPYVIAVASTDGMGNTGKLSPVFCATAGASTTPTTPTEEAGGSGCTIGVGARAAGSASLGLTLLAMTVAALRRRR